MDSSRQRVAIVTGASRRGAIGAAICRALAADGHPIAFTHWSPYDREMAWGADDDGPAVLEREIATLGVRVISIEADLTQPESVVAILDAAGRLGQPSILVNNATYSTDDGYLALDAATLDAHYAVNLRGTALLSV
ncbi:MAG: SDR family NAD(P)-dependent oxidoreductase, partial [Vicinamibacterales bacterium]